MTNDPVRRLVFRLTAVTVAILLVLSVTVSWGALRSFERVLFPELRLKAEAVGDVLSRQVERALDFGIPLDKLPGLNEAIAKEAAKHVDIAYAVIEDNSGHAVASYGRKLEISKDLEITVPLKGQGKTVATLRLGIDPAHSTRASLDLMLEVATQMLVSVLITFEVLLLVVYMSMSKIMGLRDAVRAAEAGDFRSAIPRDPANQKCIEALARVNRLFNELSSDLRVKLSSFSFLSSDERPVPPKVNLVYLRLPVFLFCLSEELSRPFLPSFAQSLASTAPWLSKDLVVSLPITMFMFIWAMAQPIGARLSRRFGRRQLFTVAGVVVAVGLMMTSFTEHMIGLLVWRCFTAVGYGMALICAQGLVVENSDATNRASGMALYVGAVLVAGVCGVSIGGIVADQAGPRATFVVGSIAVSIGILTLNWLFPPSIPVKQVGGPSKSATRLLFSNARFVSLMVLSAIPTKLAAAGILFCLIPLFMAGTGATSAEIGRVQMMYFLIFILFAPLAASLSDRWGARRGFVVGGGLITLVSFLPLFVLPYQWGAPIAMGLFGLAQGLINSPQLTLATQIARTSGVSEIDAIGWYRLLERLGGATGPLLVIWLSSLFSYLKALVIVGFLCAATAALLWLLQRRDPLTTSTAEVQS